MDILYLLPEDKKHDKTPDALDNWGASFFLHHPIGQGIFNVLKQAVILITRVLEIVIVKLEERE